MATKPQKPTPRTRTTPGGSSLDDWFAEEEAREPGYIAAMQVRVVAGLAKGAARKAVASLKAKASAARDARKKKARRHALKRRAPTRLRA